MVHSVESLCFSCFVKYIFLTNLSLKSFHIYFSIYLDITDVLDFLVGEMSSYDSEGFFFSPAKVLVCYVQSVFQDPVSQRSSGVILKMGLEHTTVMQFLKARCTVKRLVQSAFHSSFLVA